MDKNSILGKCPIVDGIYFEFVSKTENDKGITKITAKCMFCSKHLSGQLNSTGNFLDHLKRLHPEQHQAYKERKRKTEDENQNTLKRFKTGVTKAGQKQLDHAIAKFIVRSMRPISTVEDENFIDLITAARADSELKVLNRKQLLTLLTTEYEMMVGQISKELSSAEFICLTADIWSSRGRSFFGVTAHYIDNDFKRESRMLACSRFKGVHSYDRVAEKLDLIMQKFGIKPSQAVMIVTDNGSNFCKAFREFGITDAEFESLQAKLKPDDDVDESDEDGDEIEMEDVPDSNPCQYKLPPHFRCASHTLCLVATKDIPNVSSKGLLHKVMGQCQKIWNLASSPKQAEVISEVLGGSLVRPSVTRWNSLYDSLSSLLKHEEKLDLLSEKLGLPPFTERETEFLKDFLAVSTPVAIALDRLQGEKGLFMGSFLPTIWKTLEKLQTLLQSPGLSPTARLYAEAYVNGINSRFGAHLTINSENPSCLLLSTMSHPQFRLQQVPKEHHESLKLAFISVAKQYEVKSSEKNSSMRPEDVDPFYDDEGATIGQPVDIECHMFFNDTSRHLGMLTKYPTVARVFRRFNTALPSSAPVERLFSSGGLILTARRCRIKDENFETLLFLKCNGLFRDK